MSFIAQNFNNLSPFSFLVLVLNSFTLSVQVIKDLSTSLTDGINGRPIQKKLLKDEIHINIRLCNSIIPPNDISQNAMFEHEVQYKKNSLK